MFSFLSLIPVILQFLMALPGLIKEAETAFSGAPGSGALKKQFVVDSVTATMAAANAAGVSSLDDNRQKAVIAAVSSVADATVASFNAAKLFTKSTPAAPPATP
jgi:hypothetical protein